MDYAVHGILQARIVEWVAFPIFRKSSQPRDQTQVSCIAGGFFTSWASETLLEVKRSQNFVLFSVKIPDTKAYSVYWQNDLVERGKTDIRGKQ